MFQRKKKTEPINGGREDGHDEPQTNDKKKSKFYRRFAQQELKGWSPIITGNVVVLYFLAVAVVCIALGVPILKAALDVHEHEIRYDNAGVMAGRSKGEQQDILLQQNGEGVTTTVNVTITKDMNPPVYVYYELDKYYQNHKRYVRSRDDSQTGSGEGGSSKCAPEQYVNGSANPNLPHNGEINPCGLIAWSFFNDSYSAAIVGPDGAPVPLELDQSNIAWSYDRNHLYGDYTPYNFNIYPDKRGGNTSTVDVNDNQHLMVWLRPAAQPDFRKLWAVITVPLAAGTVVTFEVLNRYNTYGFGGQKSIVLSTNSWMGGRNAFLGIVYLVVAGLALLTSVTFLFTYHLGCFGLIKRRKFGDVSQLSWNRVKK
ncbi:ALA-interacting subunit 5 [Coccomyxa sp. Obi]|nr:ALA-interacting subunit 5 [Coccomyxa sp. Obi]